MPPPVEGILETALYVDDMDQSVEFYTRIFGFETIMRSQRGAALGVNGRQVFLLFQKGKSGESVTFEGGTVPGSEGDGILHMAFAVSKSTIDGWRKWLGENGVDIESTVHWERGGESIYFRDPDRHVIELVTRGAWSIY